MTKIAFEFDDLSPKNTNFHLFETIKEHYPKFCVTFFMVPWEIRFGSPTPITSEEFLPWVRALKQNKDWMEIALHGLTHLPEEFGEISYEGARKRIETAEKMMQNRGIEYAKIFKAPCWTLSKEGKKAAEDIGFRVVEDGYYNWNLKDPFPKEIADTGVPIIAHGHIQKVCGNGIEDALEKILALPTDTEFVKLSTLV